ncbi:MAG: hypothetical protein ACO1QB_18875 [Verrucomicrobiales bacterium]
MKDTHATNDLERPTQNDGLLKRIFRRKAKKPAPAEENVKGWADSATRSRNKS